MIFEVDVYSVVVFGVKTVLNLKSFVTHHAGDRYVDGGIEWVLSTRGDCNTLNRFAAGGRWLWGGWAATQFAGAVGGDEGVGHINYQIQTPCGFRHEFPSGGGSRL